MSILRHFPLPLPSQPPFGDYSHSVSQLSNTTAFATGLDRRDCFQSERCCIVCGNTAELDRGHIIPRMEMGTWEDLRRRGYIPSQARSVLHESRNGITLCLNHHRSFDEHRFFIRFVEEIQGFIFVNHSRIAHNEQHHGELVLLNPTDRLCPFQAIFLIHEWRVRGRWPFFSDRDVSLQRPEWMGHVSTRIQEGPDVTPSSSTLIGASTSGTVPSTSTRPNEDGSLGRRVAAGNEITIRIGPPDAAQIERILAFSRESPSWKACIVEGTSWEGTAEQNIEKYREIMNR
ncbi:hypothetical protein VKT23_004652 [Stygiomarasmius scandens]|uniref:HNH nuclease domain-containing protein n=1 Tax=Marasmiellus scandens TaxID=2682957 RepID=A0ABR1K0I2_9AGAR